MPDAPVFIQNAKQLFGVSNQADPPLLIKVTTYKRNSSTPIMSGTAAFNIQSMELAPFESSTLTPDGTGAPSQLTVFAEGISCKLTVIPEGTTIADALLAASIPPKGSYAKIENAPVMACGPFDSDAFNSVHWQVQSGKLNLAAGQHGGVDLELFRYVTSNMNNPHPPA